jgi:membrane protein implicated in regulation of membrane protease activity
MCVGAAAVCTAWWTGALAWTWYTFAGAAVTSAVSVVVDPLIRRLRRAPGDAVERHERLIP